MKLGTIQNDMRLFKKAGVVEDAPTRSPQHSLVVTGKPWVDPMAQWPTATRPWVPPGESGEDGEAQAEADTAPELRALLARAAQSPTVRRRRERR